MAETFLSPVIDKLLDLLNQQVTLLKGVHKEVESLKDELKIIQPFLIDAEKKLAKDELSDAAKEWLKQMREVAERIEDVIDEYLYHLAHNHHHHHRGLIISIRRAAGYIGSVKLRRNLASKIKDINESLQKVQKRGISYGLRHFEEGSSSSRITNRDASVIDPRLGSLFIGEDEFVRIDSTTNELIRSLLEGPTTRSVISLVGQGGIGKTTLARKVYTAGNVRTHFEYFAWITVSQSYNLEKVLTTMKSQICPTNEEEHVETIEGLIELLRQHLQTKRYVIVFDDVWEVDFWRNIKHVLPSSNNKGDRIIVTTRNTRIAYDAKDTPFDHVQELKTWSSELAWELFCKKAFRFEFEGHCPKELEQLSHQIISKCHGLPLVISAVAGLFSKKEKTKLEWGRVFDNLNYEFEKNPQLTSVFKILSFSYDDLPYYLKTCFLYFGIFPEDSKIYNKRLYSLWIAENFIKSRKGKTEEEVAEEYLNELIHRNLVSFETVNGIEKECRVHDLIHDVILTKCEELCFCQIINQSKLRFKGDCRRLAIHNTTKDVLNLVGSNSKIRSIFLFDIDEVTESFIISLFQKFQLLKVFDFENAPLHKLPKEIGNLFNLKYLNLRMTNVKIIPKSIGNLQNLQMLNLNKSFYAQDLPIEIYKLRSLRHILAGVLINYEKDYRFDSDIGVRIHKGIGNLEELQTLSSVRISPSTIELVKELEKLTKLKNLGIQHLTSGISTETLCSSIERMSQLEELHLHAKTEEEILDLKSLSSPPPFLRYLSLFCRLQQLPKWISKLQNLQALVLWFSRLTEEPLKYLKGLPNLAYLRMVETYVGDELHFEEGGFKRLKHLRVIHFKEMKEMKIERDALPQLEKLWLGSFPSMSEMPSDIQLLKGLKSLDIMDMSREFVVDLQPNGAGYWKIQHIPSVNFWYVNSMGEMYETYKLGESNLLERLQSNS